MSIHMAAAHQDALPVKEALPIQLARLVLLLGGLLGFFGLAWDVQWHTDVGPDTFFTLPHLFIYSGSALEGLGALAAVLIWSWVHHGGRPSIANLAASAWRAPIGFIIAGTGAAIFLAYGVYDLWWHEIYGFDVTFQSPPHIGLLLGAQITSIGTVAVFAAQAARRGAGWAPAIGLGVAVAVAIGQSVPFQQIAPPVIGPLLTYRLVPAAFYVAALLTIGAATRKTGAMLLVAGSLLLVRGAAWSFTMWATPAYATSLDLFLRDTVLGFPDTADMLSVGILPAAVAAELALMAARRGSWGVRAGVLAAGSVAGLAAAWLYQPLSFAAPEVQALTAPLLLPSLVSAPFVGMAAGWFGWNLGTILRVAADDRPASA